MTLQRKMKDNALLSLKNNWGRALSILLFQAGVLVFFLLLEQLLCAILELTLPENPALQLSWQGGLQVDGRLAVVTATALLVGAAVLTPLGMGAKRWYCGQVRGETPALLTIFSYFYSWKDLFRAVLLRIMVTVRKLLWALLFSILPAGIFIGRSFIRAESGAALAVSAALALLGVLTAVLMGILWYFVTLRYFLADYYFVSEDGLGLHAILRRSVAAMKGGKRHLFGMQLSMLPWGILSMLLLPALFTAPYYNAAMAIFAQVRMEGYRRKTEAK